MSFHIEVESGKQVNLPTAGKYCDRNIVVTGFGSDSADLQAKYDEGKAAGLDEGAAVCASKHFIYNFVGDGGTSVSFYLPFAPDEVQTNGYDPRCHTTANTITSFTADLRAFGQMGGGSVYLDSAQNSKGGRYTSTSVLSRYSRSEDGIVTIQNIHGAVFGVGFAYTVIAVKYTEQTDKERITDFVNRLTGSGTITLNRAKVNGAFTDDQWAELIATKPNHTFTWF